MWKNEVTVQGGCEDGQCLELAHDHTKGPNLMLQVTSLSPVFFVR
jgi:hypothetical protein